MKSRSPTYDAHAPTRLPHHVALDEETARAELYGLLAQLYYAPPPAELVAQLRVAVTEAPAAGGYLEEPWRVLVGVARRWTTRPLPTNTWPCSAVSTKPDVYLYGSHYLSGFLNEKPLAALRGALDALGLARDDAMSETEDHVACLCEVMRYLIAGDDVAASTTTASRHPRKIQISRVTESVAMSRCRMSSWAFSPAVSP